MLNNKSVLITGGTGSFGKMFTQMILERYPDVKRLVIYSRDELKQFEMAQLYPLEKYPQVRFFIGDVRDGARFKRACEGDRCDYSCGGIKTGADCGIQPRRIYQNQHWRCTECD